MTFSSMLCLIVIFYCPITYIPFLHWLQTAFGEAIILQIFIMEIFKHNKSRRGYTFVKCVENYKHCRYQDTGFISKEHLLTKRKKFLQK